MIERIEIDGKIIEYNPVFTISPAIKPIFELRDYQLQCVKYIMLCGKNVVIVLDTGTGKTQIALLTIDQWLQNPSLKNARFLVTAPTQLLLDQHYSRFFQFRYWQDDEVVLFKDTPPHKRRAIYQNPHTRVIISTPHCIRNDIENWIIRSNYFNLIFIDEFHCEASKDEEKISYLTAAVNLTEYCSAYAQIIGLTATPGNTQEREQRRKLLHFDEFRTIRSDKQLCYGHAINRIEDRIQLSQTWQAIWQIAKERTYDGYYNELYHFLAQFNVPKEILGPTPNFLPQKKINQLTKFIKTLLEIDEKFYWGARHLFAKLQKWERVMKYLFQENFHVWHKYFFEKLKEDRSKAAHLVYRENYNFMNMVKRFALTNTHPKMAKLFQVLESNPGKQIMIFQNLVESITYVREVLKQKGLKSNILVGKAHRSIQTPQEAKIAREEIEQNKSFTNQATKVGQIGNDFQHLYYILFLGVPNTPQQIMQAEGRLRQEGTAHYLLFGRHDEMLYYATRNKFKQELEGIPFIPELKIIVNQPVKQSRFVSPKTKHWTTDLINQHAEVITERFLLTDVRQKSFKKWGKIFFTFEDEQGKTNGFCWSPVSEIDKRASEFKKLIGQVVIVSGKVEVEEDIFEKYASIHIGRKEHMQKDFIIPCPKTDYFPADYQFAS